MTADLAQLYDERRDVHYAKPLWRGWLHLLWFEVSLVAGTLLIVRADGAVAITGMSVYSASVSALFGASALYHRGNWASVWKARLQRVDHAMIVFLIAGTATPAFLLAADGVLRAVGLGVLWSLAIGATVTRWLWMSAPERLVGSGFVALGLIAGLAVPLIWLRFGVAPATLFLTGGVLYIVGAISYHRRSPDPRPAVFGYHEVFHAYVCAAATLQYVAVAVFLV